MVPLTLTCALSQPRSRLFGERYHWHARLRTCRHLHDNVAVDAARRRLEPRSLGRSVPRSGQTRQQFTATTVRRSRRQRRTRCRRRVAAARAAAAAEQSPKRVAKVAIEARIDDRVERRVGIADPEQDGDAPFGQFRTCVGAQRGREVPGEERQPADEKRAHDDAQRLGGLVFALHQSALPRTLAVERPRRSAIQRRDAEPA